MEERFGRGISKREEGEWKRGEETPFDRSSTTPRKWSVGGCENGTVKNNRGGAAKESRGIGIRLWGCSQEVASLLNS